MGCRLVASILLLLGSAGGGAANGAELTVFRCVDGRGAVRLQDQPCPADMTEQARRMRRPLDAAPLAPTPAQASTPSAAAPRDAPPATRPRRTPAPRYECLRDDGVVYENETGVPEVRWVPLWTLGLDPRAPARTFGRTGAKPERRDGFRPRVPERVEQPELALGPGAWVEDVCRPLSLAELCRRQRAAIEELRHRAASTTTGEAARLNAERARRRVQFAEECGA
jgi:hypothetical protein